MMNKYFIAIAALIVIISFIFLFAFLSTQPATFQLRAKEEDADQAHINGDPTERVGVGWSIKNDPREAVIEAVSKAKKRLGRAEPEYAFVTFVTGYDQDQVIDEVRRQLGSSVKIHGTTSAYAVITNEGVHRGKIGSIGVLLVSSDRIDFGVSSLEVDKFDSPQTAGRMAILYAIRDAGRTDNTVPNMILYGGSPRRGDDMLVLDGIAQVVGPDIPVIGGNAGDEVRDASWRQFTHSKTYSNGLVLTAIFTDLNLGWALDAGGRVTDKEGIITRSEGNVIYQINGRPALDVYNEWLDGDVIKNVKDAAFKESIRFTGHYPLCRVLRDKSGKVGYYPMHPVLRPKNIKDKTLNIAVPVEEGSEIRLYSSSWESVLNRAEGVSHSALISAGIESDSGIFGIMYFCYGLTLLLPESELDKVVALTKNILGNTFFIGTLTLGEHGPIAGIRNVNANLLESIVIVGKDSRKSQ